MVKMEDSVHGQIFNSNDLKQVGGSAEESYLALRQNIVRRYFPDATGVDDFMARVEMELCDYGFNADNSIGVFPHPSLKRHTTYLFATAVVEMSSVRRSIRPSEV
jgi:hypothetical protein